MAARDRHRRRRDPSGHVDPFYQRRKRYEAVLRPMGLWERWAAVPRPYQEMFWRLKFPDPVVVFDEAAAKAAEHAPKGLRPATERYLRSATVTVDGSDGGVEMPARDFISIVAGLKQFCEIIHEGGIPELATTGPESLKAFVAEAAPALRRCHAAHLQAAWDAMYSRVMMALVQASRLDGQLFTARLDATPDDRGRDVMRVIVSVTPSDVRQVALDGAARPAHRVGRINTGTNQVRWVSWDGGTFPGGTPGREYPVYVQSHALRNLHERVGRPVRGAGPWLESWMGDALVAPKIAERQGADLLVEYWLKSYKLGYLVVTPVDGQGCIVVRTFKLLTMENTPEARKLERKLKLSRPDVNWLRLHELESFTHTDLRRDPLLRRLMEECGCGHLFKLAEEHDFAPQPKALAAEVRKYLRLAA
jgi:hypothetical protein